MKLSLNLEKLTSSYKWIENTIGHSSATVYFLEGTNQNMYLKIQPVNSPESLATEKDILVWLEGKLPVPKVIQYENNDEHEFLLMTEVKGKMVADPEMETDLSFRMKLLGKALREFHSIDIKDCPFQQTLNIKIAKAEERVQKGLVDEDDFDEIRNGKKATEIYEELISKRPKSEDLVFCHGDYCLPNIIFDNNQLSGFIDLGRAGVSDRYQDIALAIRSIKYNFGEAYVGDFLQAYGLREIDESKVFYYQLLDEFF